MLFVRFFCMLFLLTSFLTPSWAMEEEGNKIEVKYSSRPKERRVKQLLKQQRDKEEVDLSGQNLTAKDIGWVVTFLKNRTNLPIKELDLSGNSLGNKGVRLICEGLKSTPELEKLYLLNNNIGNEGLGFIRGVLGDIPKIKLLCLGGNNFKGKEIDNFYQLIEQIGYYHTYVSY